MSIPFAKPDITEAEVEAASEALRSGWVTTGPRTARFETEFAEAVGADHALALNSCTAALHLALEALGIQAGDEVIVPALTFAATAEVVRYLGANPVIVDVKRTTHNIDPAAIEAAITPKTRAVMPVHFAGQPCDMDAILSLADQHDLYVIEDAAHAFPVKYKDRWVGSIGDATCFSFYANKTMTTGEGGMLTSQDEDLIKRAKVMSLHGLNRDAWKREAYGNRGWYYEIVAPGFKYNLTDIASAIGLVQLSRSRDMLASRQRVALAYREAFAGLDTIELPVHEPDRGHAYHIFPIKLRTEALSIGRDGFIEALRERGIGTSVHFIPLHVHPYYRDLLGLADDAFPVTWDIFQRTLSIPIFSTMTEAQTATVIEAVQDISAANRR